MSATSNAGRAGDVWPRAPEASTSARIGTAGKIRMSLFRVLREEICSHPKKKRPDSMEPGRSNPRERILVVSAVGTTLQGGTLVLAAVAVLGILVARAARARSLAKLRPVQILLVDLAAIMQHGQPILHIVELGGGHDVLRLLFEHGLDILLRRLDVILVSRIRRENFRHRPRLLLFHRLNLFEEVDQRFRVVAGFVE